jgi:hypothetical protein
LIIDAHPDADDPIRRAGRAAHDPAPTSALRGPSFVRAPLRASA